MLLGIKYEAAKIGDVGDDALAGIEEQMKREVGEGWASDERYSGDATPCGVSTAFPASGGRATGPLRPPPPDFRSGAGS